MKLSTSQINTFLEKPSAEIRIILLFGPDSGLIHERGENLSKKTVTDLHDPFSVSLLSVASALEDKARLLDEMATPSLLSNKRLVRIMGAPDTLTPAVQNLIESMPDTESVLILEAGDLDKRSKLRGLCESTPLAVAIPCYIETGERREKVIAEAVRSEGFTISRDALAYCAAVLPPDRLALRSELTKLFTYRGNEKTIHIEDVQAIIGDAGAAELDDLVLAVGSGDIKKVLKLLDHLFAEQVSTVAILRAMLRHFMRLQWARSYIDGGLSATEAVKKLQPPLFWKHEEVFVSQINRWNLDKIDRALSALLQTEIAVKSTGANDQALTAQTLLALGRSR